MKKHILLTLALFATLALLAGCTEEPTGSGGGVVQFAIDVESPKLLQQQPIDSLWAALQVTGPDMEAIDTTARVQPDGTFELRAEIPVGRSRTFVLELYKEVAPVIGAPQQQPVGATLLYVGQTTMDVSPSRVTTVGITLIPALPMLKLTPMVTRITAGDTFRLELRAYNMPGLSGVNAVFDYGYGIYPGGNNAVDPLDGTAPAWFPATEYFYSGGDNDNTQYRVTITDSSGGVFPLARGGTVLATMPFATNKFTDTDSSTLIIPLGFVEFQTWLTLTQELPGGIWFESSELIIDPVKDSVLVFPDPVFRDVVASNYWGTTDSNIHLSEALKMYRLDFVEWPVSSIAGIGVLQNLGVLDAGYNDFSDLGPLRDLKSLYSLSIQGNAITDISPLASLTSLSTLSLYSNSITSITALSSMQWLWDVDLSYNQIQNIAPLASATGMWRLNLRSNQISNLSALQNLTNLHYLDLAGNQITDIAALVNNAGLASGDTVMLHANPLSVEAAETQVRALQQRGVYVTQGF